MYTKNRACRPLSTCATTSSMSTTRPSSIWCASRISLNHRTRAVVASLQLPTSIAGAGGERVWRRPLSSRSRRRCRRSTPTSDELQSSLSPPSPPHVSSDSDAAASCTASPAPASQPDAGKRRAELVHKYGELAARARHFDRSLAETAGRASSSSGASARSTPPRSPLPPTRESGSLDASERLARRIAQRDFEDGADYAQAWSSGNNHHIGVVANNNSVAFSSPPLLATPTAPSVAANRRLVDSTWPHRPAEAVDRGQAASVLTTESRNGERKKKTPFHDRKPRTNATINMNSIIEL
jgi:hypothetical protein